MGISFEGNWLESDKAQVLAAQDGFTKRKSPIILGCYALRYSMRRTYSARTWFMGLADLLAKLRGS